MIAKQYALTLPADYDMRIVRERVATKGPSFDGMPGLTLKAFLIREKGRFGAIANEYSPFYAWHDVGGLWDFVAGPGFRGIVDSFGWTSIMTWLPLDVSLREAIDAASVQAATREDVVLAAGTDLAALRAAEVSSSRAMLDDPRVVAHVVAVDPQSWRLVRFGLWSCTQDQLDESRRAGSYEVLRLSLAR